MISHGNIIFTITNFAIALQELLKFRVRAKLLQLIFREMTEIFGVSRFPPVHLNPVI
jgi:hypothetical protein